MHTPGPWKLDDEKNPESASIVAADGDFVVAGEMDGWMRPFTCRGEEGAANARLIAAAPDLLSALEGLLSNIADDDSGDGTNSQAILLYEIRNAKAAVAKAKGIG